MYNSLPIISAFQSGWPQKHAHACLWPPPDPLPIGWSNIQNFSHGQNKTCVGDPPLGGFAQDADGIGGPGLTPFGRDGSASNFSHQSENEVQPEASLGGGPPSSSKGQKRYYLNVKSLSVDSQKSSASSRGSDSSPGLKSIGGSYSARTGASSKIIADSCNLPPPVSGPMPKLGQVAAALLRAKKAGQLPSAFGCPPPEKSELPEGPLKMSSVLPLAGESGPPENAILNDVKPETEGATARENSTVRAWCKISSKTGQSTVTSVMPRTFTKTLLTDHPPLNHWQARRWGNPIDNRLLIYPSILIVLT